MNVFAALTPFFLGLLIAAVGAAPAKAGDFSFQVKGKKGSIGIHLGSGHHGGHSSARPVGYAPRHWVPAHYETRYERVWIPGREERVWIAPVYQWRYDSCGRAIRVCVQQGYWNTVCTPGRYESRPRQVWVEGCYGPRHHD
jgi:hypothetical protein